MANEPSHISIFTYILSIKFQLKSELNRNEDGEYNEQTKWNSAAGLIGIYGNNGCFYNLVLAAVILAYTETNRQTDRV